MDKQSLAHSAQSPPEEQREIRECRSCYGAGEVLKDVEVAFEWYEVRADTCPTCQGTGKVSVYVYPHTRRSR